MPLIGIIGLLANAGAGADDAVVLPPAAARPVDFVRDIKPLFESSCIQCHAKGKEKGGFSLETRAAMLKGGDDGPAVVVGESAASSIVKLVAGVDPDSVMPKKGTKWTAAQVGLLRAWIDGGLKWDANIAFARPEPANFKPRAVVLPAVGGTHPVDRILAAYFGARHITPPPVVDDRLFARRAYLDIIGLLPTPAQLDEFVAEGAPGKRDRLVRVLLQNRREYADHWLTFWNDLLRNDYRGAGFIDGGRRQITPWLYKALVENEPYDRFVADLVNPSGASEGFSRGIIWRGAVNASQLPPLQAAQNISQVFMGVNLKCASCHDSFVNDWTLADAYGLAAVYSDDALELVHCDKPTGKIASPRFLYPQLGTLPPNLPRAQRLAKLAALITSPGDGRLSRTIVNRLWAKLLGRGIVEPLDDMEKPAWSSDLLDWLADDLVAHHYDLKRTIEMIMTSQAYQLPSVEMIEEKTFTFVGPQIRRLTAEQFCDALSGFDEDWPRMPATFQFDFAAGGLIAIKPAAWIWTDEAVDAGQKRALEQQKAHAGLVKSVEEMAVLVAAPTGAKPAIGQKSESDDGESEKAAATPGSAPAADAKAKKQNDPPPRHHVGFRTRFELQALPREAYAVLGASQGSSLWINGREARPLMADGRVALYDVKTLLREGINHVVLDVSSHTEKNNLNDAEKEKYPADRNHLNKISGVAFYLRAGFADESVREVVSDDSWQTLRAPAGRWRQDLTYDASDWDFATALPRGVTPIDEGPAQLPITRKDFANQAIDVAPAFYAATTTASQPGGIRAALLTADPLMTALDRPSREQVMTSRSSAATTLQALALTNGSSLDARLKRIAAHLAPEAAKNPEQFVKQMYVRALCREPDPAELNLSVEAIGKPVKADGVADFLWALTMLPEFQYVH